MAIKQLRCTFRQDFQDDFPFIAQGTVMDLPEALARSLNQRGYVDLFPGAIGAIALTPGGSSGGGVGGGVVVTITGTPGVNNTLLAVLASGYAVTSYQWTRNGVDIVGGTGSAYLQVLADVGTYLSVRVGGITFSGTPLLVPTPGGGGGTPTQTYAAEDYFLEDYAG